MISRFKAITQNYSPESKQTKLRSTHGFNFGQNYDFQNQHKTTKNTVQGHNKIKTKTNRKLRSPRPPTKSTQNPYSSIINIDLQDHHHPAPLPNPTSPPFEPRNPSHHHKQNPNSFSLFESISLATVIQTQSRINPPAVAIHTNSESIPPPRYKLISLLSRSLKLDLWGFDGGGGSVLVRESEKRGREMNR